MPEGSFLLPRPEKPHVQGWLRGVLSWFEWPDQLARAFSTEDVYQQPLDGHGISYLAELLTEYDNLDGNRRPHAEADAAVADIRRRAALAEDLEQQIVREKDAEKKKDLEQQFERIRLSWDDLLRLESALLQLLPDDRLRKRAWNIRNEFKEVAGDAVYARYLDRHPPDPDKEPKIDLVRADAEELLSELHWCYISEPVQESQRTRLLFTVLFGMVGVLLLGALFCAVWLALRLRYPEMRFPLIIPIMFVGAVGASFSSLLRLQRTSFEGNAVVNLWKLNVLGVSAIVAPFVGALSAVLLTFIFAGQFLKVDLVPQVSVKLYCEPCEPCISTNRADAGPAPQTATGATSTPPAPAATGATNTPTSTVVRASGSAPPAEAGAPATSGISTNAAGKSTAEAPEKRSSRWPYYICVAAGVELAKLLIWCFVAGFSERMVPDIIDRLAEKAK